MPKVRIHLDAPLGEGARLALDPGRAHYVATVMRLRVGARLALFNGRDGEWAAEVVAQRRDQVSVLLGEQTRAQQSGPDLWFTFAPVKRARIDLIAEKATELGVSRLMPVITKHTMVERVNTGRLAVNAREAAEQCGRLDLSRIDAPVSFARLLGDWPPARRLIFCDERGAAPAAATALAALEPGPAAILVGPEGGFAEAEARSLRAHEAVVPVSLGPRRLRAETAVIAALVLWQAHCGDWRRSGDG